MADASHRPTGIDTGTPSPARLYDYWLGGKNNFPADQAAGKEIVGMLPELPTILKANRRYLVRVVRYLARQGIDQFLDLGAGIPTSPNVHEVAREVQPDARVVYVDNDPKVRIYNRAILRGDGVVSIEGDIREPERVLANEELRKLIDFDRPTAVLFVAILHFIGDEYRPAEIIRTFMDPLPSGSYLALSAAVSDDNDPRVIKRVEEIYQNATAPFVWRTRQQVHDLLTGFELVEPGLVSLGDWHPDSRSEMLTDRLGATWFCAAAARKP